MNPKILIFLSCVLTHACSAMDQQEEPKDRHALTHKLCREYTIWKKWANRTQCEQALMKHDQARWEDYCQSFPLAPQDTQVLWQEALILAGVPKDDQFPLYVSALPSRKRVDLITAYRTALIGNIALFLYEKIFRGVMRYCLIHEATHIALNNVAPIRKADLALLMPKLTQKECTLCTYACQRPCLHTTLLRFLGNVQNRGYTNITTFIALNALRSNTICQIESETDMATLKVIDCARCLKEMAAFCRQIDFMRTLLGYASVEHITKRALELTGKSCSADHAYTHQLCREYTLWKEWAKSHE